MAAGAPPGRQLRRGALSRALTAEPRLTVLARLML
jgi:hypothetical protein